MILTSSFCGAEEHSFQKHPSRDWRVKSCLLLLLAVGCNETSPEPTKKQIPNNYIEVVVTVVEFYPSVVYRLYANWRCERLDGTRLRVLEPKEHRDKEFWIYHTGDNPIDSALKVLDFRLDLAVPPELFYPEADMDYEISSGAIYEFN